mgnify:CR=1 FL=1
MQHILETLNLKEYDKITIDENELSEAEWFHRDEMNVEDDGISLTRAMMTAFKERKHPL